jgi:peptide/nickel transport system permease protein
MSIVQIAPAVGGRGVAARLARLDVVTVLAAIVVGALVLAAVAAPLVAPFDPTQVDPIAVYQAPSVHHWLGTDDTGRDILSRLIYGGRISLLGPALVVAISAAVGTVVAVAAAWTGGWVDAIISRGLDTIFAFPGLILAIVVATAFGTGFVAPVLALSIAYVPYIARVVRTAALRERNLPYIAALEIQGFSSPAICLRHLVPNVLPLLVVQSTVAFGYALLDLAAISFLGLGTQPPTAEWGLMVANGQPSIIAGHNEQALYAGLTILIAVVAFNLLGERLARTLLEERR